MNFKEMTAPCGIPCFECGAYKATSNDQIKKQISNKLGLDYEKSDCHGCRDRKGIGYFSEHNNVFPNGKCLLLNKKGQCFIYLCVEQKKIHNCSECDNFPCDKLQPYADKANIIPHNTKIYNLCLIKKIGLEEWAEKKAKDVMKKYMSQKIDQKK